MNIINSSWKFRKMKKKTEIFKHVHCRKYCTVLTKVTILVAW